MRNKLFLVFILLFLIGWFCFRTSDNGSFSEHPGYPVEMVSDSTIFTLNKGDILVRPNWSWLPGSYPVKGGRKFGHVAVVTEDASGKTVDEVLANATVIEALLYDQATRKFLFRKEDQIREGKASVAFGSRFKGIRYRLRTNLTFDQAEALVKFLRNQLEGGYNLFSIKKRYPTDAENQIILNNLKQDGWQCAALTWEAYYLAAGVDIDANGGRLIYPSDMIASENFDSPGGRVRF